MQKQTVPSLLKFSEDQLDQFRVRAGIKSEHFVEQILHQDFSSEGSLPSKTEYREHVEVAVAEARDLGLNDHDDVRAYVGICARFEWRHRSVPWLTEILADSRMSAPRDKLRRALLALEQCARIEEANAKIASRSLMGKDTADE